ncbi:hypothetical protein IAU60_000368 [Kwoniella sp. DSM 27419]
MSTSSSSALGPAEGEPVIPPANPSNPPELPWAFSDCPVNILVDLLSHMLDLLIKHNDQVLLTPDALTRFHSRAAPGISVVDYLSRIVKYTNLEKIPLLSLLAYIDTTCLNLPTFTLSSLTVHRFLIASVCAGSKAQCDVFCTNAHYAKVGGIKTGELNALERELLRVTKWDLCCHADQLQKYYASLIRSHGGYVQASSPVVSPFLPFPRSRSKPRTAEPSPPLQPVESAEDEEGDEIDEDDEMDGAGNKDDERGNAWEDAGERMMVDVSMAGAEEPEPVERGRTKGKRKVSQAIGMPNVSTAGETRMEVDPTSPQSNEAGPSTSPYSAASSSIPSSSRSSLRGSIKRRGRAASHVSIPRLAEPQVNTTAVLAHTPPSATDEPGASGTDLGRRDSLARLRAQSNASGGVTAASGPDAGAGSMAPPEITRPTSTAPMAMPSRPSHDSRTADSFSSSSHPGPQSHPDPRSSSEPQSLSQPHAHAHSHSSSHHGGKLLKSLVGGIFGRKHSHSEEGMEQHDGAGGAQGRGRAQNQNHVGSIPSGAGSQATSVPQPASQTGHAIGAAQARAHAQVQVQAPAPAPAPAQHSGSPRLIATSPRIHTSSSTFTPTGGITAGAGAPGLASPVSHPPPAPGPAQAVTPRVRTRAERSIDASDRVALGAPAAMH